MALGSLRGFGSSGLPREMERLMERKYDIKQQQADAQTTTAGASQLNAKTAAGLAPSQIGLNQSRAANLDIETELAPERARFQNLLTGAQASNQDALTDKYNRGAEPLGFMPALMWAMRSGMLGGGSSILTPRMLNSGPDEGDERRGRM